MTLKMGGAHIDEHGNITGGTAGDQTGTEVCRKDWYVYSKGWDFVAFHPDANVRELHAQAVEQACDNDNVGYDQGERNTLFKQAKLVSWIIKNIKTPCECDCSSLQDVAAICSGGVSSDDYGSNGPATGSMRSWFKNHGYVIITASKYLTNSIYSLRGAVYVSEGHHTECALGNGSNYKDLLAAGGVSDSSSSTTKSIDELAQEVIAGKWGDGDTRKTALKNAGYDYDKVQARVNEILGTTSSGSGSNTGTSMTGSTSPNRPNYIVGKTYTLQCNLAVRKSPSKDAALVGYKNLTSDGKAHDTDKNGYLEKGTKVTCKSKVQKSSSEMWIKTPSGYMCGYDSSQVYIK